MFRRERGRKGGKMNLRSSVEIALFDGAALQDGATHSVVQ